MKQDNWLLLLLLGWFSFFIVGMMSSASGYINLGIVLFLFSIMFLNLFTFEVIMKELKGDKK